MASGSSTKPSYKIPFSLNVSRWDSPVSLSWRSQGISMKHPIKLSRLLIIAIAGGVPTIYVIMKLPWKETGLVGPIIALLAYWLLIALTVLPQSNGLDGWKWIIPTFKYLVSKNERAIITRGDNDVAKVESVLEVKDVDSGGTIHFTNDWVGSMYSIDGEASTMLFEADRRQVLAAYEGWLRQLPPHAGITITTQFAPLKLDKQILAAKTKINKQTTPELRALAERQYNILSRDIAHSFKTISQWMIISAPDEQMLAEQREWLETQVAGGMAKQVTRNTYEEVTKNLAEYFRY